MSDEPSAQLDDDVTTDEQMSPAAWVARRNALFPLGIDFWPFDDERQSADAWYADEDINAKFAAFAEARFSLVRIFVSWKYVEPQVGQYEEEAFERLDRIVEAAQEHRLQLVVCFFADDRMSELPEATWGKRRDARTDSYLLQREVALVQRIVNRYRAAHAIWAWDLANEAFMSGFIDEKELRDWVSVLRASIREIDSDRPVTVSIDPETFFRATAVDAVRVLDECEFIVSHRTSPYEAYAAPGPVTSGPSTYLDSYLLRSARRDLPVLVDGVGSFALDESLTQEASRVRTGLYSAVMNRAAGVVLRRWRDVDADTREPYFRDPYEVLVGLNDTGGDPKPALAEVASFARVVARLDLRRYTLTPERVAVLVPSERYDPLPSMSGLYDPRSCLQAFMLAKEAHLPVDVVRERDRTDDFGVLVIPSAMRLSRDAWSSIAAFVHTGGAVVLSYGGGDPDPAIRDVFGVEFLGDGGPRAGLSCRVAQRAVLGAADSFDERLELPAFAQLGAGNAMVVATDATGSPLLTLNTYGQGRGVLIAAPLERALAQAHVWDAASPARMFVRSVYGAAARMAGAAAPYACDRPEVEVALFSGDDDILLMLNHAPERLTANVTMERGVATVGDVRGGAPAEVAGRTFGVPLSENGAAALRLTYR